MSFNFLYPSCISCTCVVSHTKRFVALISPIAMALRIRARLVEVPLLSMTYAFIRKASLFQDGGSQEAA